MKFLSLFCTKGFKNERKKKLIHFLTFWEHQRLDANNGADVEITQPIPINRKLLRLQWKKTFSAEKWF